MRECPKIRQINGNGAIEYNLHQFFHQIEVHLQEILKGQAEKETIFMPSPVFKRKRTRQMLSVV